MEEPYDRSHAQRNFVVGDKVLLRLWKGYNMPVNHGLTTKPGQQYAGCFRVLERIGRLAYKLDLPPSWRIHPGVSIEHLEPAPSPDPFGRELANPEPTTDKRFPDDEDCHEVERVLDKRVR